MQVKAACGGCGAVVLKQRGTAHLMRTPLLYRILLLLRLCIASGQQLSQAVAAVKGCAWRRHAVLLDRKRFACSWQGKVVHGSLNAIRVG